MRNERKVRCKKIEDEVAHCSELPRRTVIPVAGADISEVKVSGFEWISRNPVPGQGFSAGRPRGQMQQ